MEIGEFSNKTRITIDTLRYYNKIGLLVPDKINNRRWYTEEDLEKADIIKRLKCLNFSLEEIKILFDLDREIDDTDILNSESRDKIKYCYSIIEQKYNDIIQQERDLIMIKSGLEKMISKTTKLLTTGCIPPHKDTEKNNIGKEDKC